MTSAPALADDTRILSFVRSSYQMAIHTKRGDNSDIMDRKPYGARSAMSLLLHSERSAALILLSLMLVGCHRVQPKAAAPPPPPAPVRTNFEVGETDFEAGRYPEAALAYEAYLNENPKGAMADKALMHLALSYGLGDNEDDESGYWKVHKNLTTLVTQFPQSPYKLQAKYILYLQELIEKKKVDIQEKERLLQAKAEPPPEKIVTVEDPEKEVREKRLQRQDKALQEKDKQIQDLIDANKKLTDELERIKKIDLQRHPSRPPG